MIAYPFKGRRTCPRVRGDENGLRRHAGGGDSKVDGRRREGSTDISRFAGLLLLVNGQWCGWCDNNGAVPAIVVVKK